MLRDTITYWINARDVTKVKLRYIFLLGLIFPNVLYTQSYTADKIFSKTKNVYANCRTYRDSGVVRIRYHKLLNWTEKRPFRTAFLRPHKFKYEFWDYLLFQKRRYLIWAQDSTIVTWWDVTQTLEKEKTLDMALAGATGVSGGSAHTIPKLLLADQINGSNLLGITNPSLLGTESIKNSICYKINGVYVDAPITIWIDTTSYLVKRIEMIFKDIKTDQITDYQPEINGVIPDINLLFDPPEKR